MSPHWSEFGGDTIEPVDGPRLSTQLYWVYAIMFDAKWRTIGDLVSIIREKHDTNVMQTSISARLRDFRKNKFGGHTVNRNNLGGGLFEYQLIVRKRDETDR
jgi:hypothetical protein